MLYLRYDQDLFYFFIFFAKPKKQFWILFFTFLKVAETEAYIVMLAF